VKRRFFLIPVFLVCFLSVTTPLFSVEADFHGFVDTYQGVKTVSSEKGSFQSSRTRAGFELELSQGETMARAAVHAVHDTINSSNESFELREAYMQYESEYLDLRAGRQIIIWGNAEGFQVTDIVSPKDYSEFLANDFDDMRIPVDSFRARIMKGPFTVEAVFIPVFTPAIVPYAENGASDSTPWARELPQGVILNEEVLPDRKIQNSEAAGRILFRNSLFDISILGMYGWDDQPLMIYENDEVTPEYRKMKLLGGELTVPMGDFIIRGEGGYTMDKWFLCNDSEYTPVQKNTYSYVVGLDWSPGNNFNLSVQYYEFSIMDYQEDIISDEHSRYVTFSLSKKFFRETLTFYSMIFWGIEQGDLYNRTSLEYSISDSMKLSAGYDLFSGEEGSFGEYDDMDQVFLKVEYLF